MAAGQRWRGVGLDNGGRPWRQTIPDDCQRADGGESQTTGSARRQGAVVRIVS